MPDLGKYSDAILLSWATALGLLIALVLVSWRRSVQVKKALEAAEKRSKQNV